VITWTFTEPLPRRYCSDCLREVHWYEQGYEIISEKELFEPPTTGEHQDVCLCPECFKRMDAFLSMKLGGVE
jgi:hypothetical protein